MSPTAASATCKRTKRFWIAECAFGESTSCPQCWQHGTGSVLRLTPMRSWARLSCWPAGFPCICERKIMSSSSEGRLCGEGRHCAYWAAIGRQWLAVRKTAKGLQTLGNGRGGILGWNSGWIAHFISPVVCRISHVKRGAIGIVSEHWRASGLSRRHVWKERFAALHTWWGVHLHRSSRFR